MKWTLKQEVNESFLILHFYGIGTPYYLKDGKRFIFSANTPLKLITQLKDDGSEKFEKSQIFIIDDENNVLNPFLEYGERVSMRMLADDDTVLFVSCLEKHAGRSAVSPACDLFLKGVNKEIIKITNMQIDNFQAHISLDGSRILFRKQNEWSIWLINSDGSGLREVIIPIEKIQK